MTQLSSVINFRDVGETINSHLGKRWISPGLLYRSARPDDASVQDRKVLREEIGIKTVVDLRTTTEHEQQAEKREKRIAELQQAREEQDAEEADDTAKAERPLQIPGLHYELVNFNGWPYSRYLMSQLTWFQFFNLLYCMATKRRLEGISILGQNVMQPRGLAGLAVDSIDTCTAEVKAVFDILALESNFPILVHCTQGKDRTGLVVQMILMLLGTPVEAIEADYMLSAPELAREREAKLAEIRSIGLPDEFADCDPGLVPLVHKHITTKHGSIEAYLESCGVTADVQQRIRDRLLGADNDSSSHVEE